VGKLNKSFKDYVDETDGLRKKKLKKESRHNFKDHLRDVMETEDWDALEDELYEESHSNHYR
jgi:hypothetical protein